MYAPSDYRERDLHRMIELVEQHSFGVLVTVASGRPVATHLPMFLSEERDEEGRPRRLLSHMAAGNAQGRDARDGDAALAIFSGPSAYITPRWYADEPDVPTWNYSAVHVGGHYRRLNDAADVRELLEKTVARYEAGQASPWSLSEIDERVVVGFQRGVTAFAIEITSIVGATKHSQDKTPADRARVIAGLSERKRGEDAVLARLMSDAAGHAVSSPAT